MHLRVLQSCGLYPEKYSVVVWYDLLPTSSVVRVCWLNFGLLTLSLSSFPFYFLQYRAWNRFRYKAYRIPSHLLPIFCFAGIVFIASEVNGSPWCTKSFRGCDEGLRKWQFHDRGCDEGLPLLWLWRRPVATAPIQPLAWVPPYAAGAAQEIATTTTTTTKDKKTKKKKKTIFIRTQTENFQ